MEAKELSSKRISGIGERRGASDASIQATPLLASAWDEL